jgi:uncharacterized protein YcsI (UPF0317 family)
MPSISYYFVKEIPNLVHCLKFSSLVSTQRRSQLKKLILKQIYQSQPCFALSVSPLTVHCVRYRIFRDGELVEEVADISTYWRDDLVTFLIGCSFSFEEVMANCSIPVRHIEEQKNVPMFNTNIACQSAGIFK